MKHILISTALLIFSFTQSEAQNIRDAIDLKRITISDNWQFRMSGAKKWLPASVPGYVHTDLFNNKVIGDPFYRINERDQQWIDKVNWEYHTTFTTGPEFLSRHNQRLLFNGLDTYADVYLNDTKILSADNMFRIWPVDVKGILKESNELHIVLKSPVDTDLPKIEDRGYQLPAINDQSENGGLGNRKISIFARKAPYHYGWDWGPRFVTMGIWRPVQLEAWDKVRIQTTYFRQSGVSEEIAHIKAIVEIESSEDQQITVVIRGKGTDQRLVSKILNIEKGLDLCELDFEIKNPRLWWSNGLGESHVYDFITELSVNNRIADQRSDKVGIRNLRIVREKDAKGQSFYIELNGVPVFAKGANYIPNDVFVPRVTPENYEHIIQSAADANMNMLRVWGGGIYENDVFYDLCDQYGILVWQDFIFACSMYPGDEPFLENVKREAVDNIKRLRNHPSIALWCGNNEIDAAWSHNTPGGWGWKERYDEETQSKLWADYEKIFHNLLPDLVKEFDPDRFYWPSSPLADFGVRASYSNTSGDMHYWGVWHGREPFENFKNINARFMSEYGFQSFPEFKTVKSYTIPEDWNITSEVMSAHQRSGIGNERIRMYMEWDYHLPKTFEDMLYLSHVLQARGIKEAIEAHRLDKPYCMGTLYWQINDCWPVASWSSIDYYGRWKALHYYAKKAYAPVVVIPTVEEEQVTVSIISDRPQTFKGNVHIQVLDFSGRVLWELKQGVRIPANGNEKVFTTARNKLLEDSDLNHALLFCSLTEKNKPVSQNILYFKPPKQLDLPQVNVMMTVEETPDGYALTLVSDHLAKNVYLTCDMIEGFFSDNCFDLLPDQEVTIMFRPAERAPHTDGVFRIKTLRETYE